MASQDNIYLMVGMFASAIVILILASLWSQLSSVDAIWAQADVGSTIKSNTQSFMDNLDWIMLCLYIGTHLSVIVLSFLLRTHPVMFVVSIGIILVMMLIAPVLSNSYETILANSAFSGVAGDFPMLTYIMQRLPLFEFIWAILTMILLYGFSRTEE